MKEQERISPPLHRQIAWYWQDRPEFARAFDNAPACFACCEGVGLWCDLQRAHIVARSQGGNFEPQNFVLLCRECHIEQPMVADRALVIEWVQQRPHFTQWFVDLFQKEREFYGPNFQFDDSDGKQLMEFLRLKALRFHPHGDYEAKIRGGCLYDSGVYVATRSSVQEAIVNQSPTSQ